MLELEEVYEPDEILRDVDFFDDVSSDDELYELSFETTREALDGYSLLIDDVESSQDLFSLN